MTSEKPDGNAGRGDLIGTIQRELTEFARRSRATAIRIHPELPLVSYTLLAHVDARQGCSATELAAHYLLDKSTVSRQVSALERLGLVERRSDPADHRVADRALHCGRRPGAAAGPRRPSGSHQRPGGGLGNRRPRPFADLLSRYNTAPGGPPRGPEPA